MKYLDFLMFPMAGDSFNAVKDDKVAREIAESREDEKMYLQKCKHYTRETFLSDSEA